ncbi:MAG: DUF3373 family protein [Campylobacterota bacterium]|nr:DUF3373 family protein [Campylobacterota bacterium]
MNKFIVLSTIAALSTISVASEVNYQEQIDELTAQIKQLQKNEKRTKKKLSKVNAQSAKDNIKFDVDFRTSYDNLQYNMTGTGMDGEMNPNPKKYKNDALYAMRLWLGMGYAPDGTNMIFKGQLSMNKAFGASYGQRATGHGFDEFDWIRNEQLTDDSVHVREAYWLWTPSIGGVGTTFSVGRRPATNGYLINLREDDKAKSPLGHVINMEFDGASASVSLDQLVTGSFFKLCAGRGLTNAASWASQATYYVGSPVGSNQPNYSTVDSSLDNTDMLGFIIKAYDDGQYALEGTYYRGFNVPGMLENPQFDPQKPIDQTNPAMLMNTVGNMDGAALSFKVEGIGDEINDFLDETIFFASYAWTKSDPKDGGSMLGSMDSETGSSYWVGLLTPNLTGGKFGLEYNHGSEHWKPFTYGEDTMVGSKMAVRGSAYEAYWTQPIIGRMFSMQVRYTYLDYDYTGSDGFFGSGGAPIDVTDTATLTAYNMNAIDTAQDIRVYFRYRY